MRMREQEVAYIGPILFFNFETSFLQFCSLIFPFVLTWGLFFKKLDFVEKCNKCFFERKMVSYINFDVNFVRKIEGFRIRLLENIHFYHFT